MQGDILSNDESIEFVTRLSSMSADEVLAIGEAILKRAFYQTPINDYDDKLLTTAFQLRRISSEMA